MPTTNDVRTDALLTPTEFHPSVSWRSIVAGVLISLFSFAVLASLGVAFGGISLANTADMSAESTGFAAIGWIVLTAAISLFIASYFAARISNFRPRRIGMAQAAVVTAIFFGIVLSQSAMLVGALGRTTGSLVGGAVAMSGAAMNSNVVSDLIEDNLGDLKLSSDSRMVVNGVASRLLRGDVDSAKAYLANQTNLSQADIDSRINTLQVRVNEAMDKARQSAASALQASGWSLFATLIVGLLGALFGGALGSGVNIRLPMTSVEPAKGFRTAYAS